ncbi:hypothetical protein [Coleofasciculus sp. FACHB-T130]|uniref:hypothetical protein n=1 Tax=Cyanophyceae TaxID=3028117 RepID=UPI00168950BD|nr:hypothetical protein [Coleofasciculus sp. FACHB-T130]MBD1879084.1 hypothetical protein [Coleofasciculus sp. FACHB-T130]
MTENDILGFVQSTELLHPLALEAFGLGVADIADAVLVEPSTIYQYRASKGAQRRRNPSRSVMRLAALKGKELVADIANLKNPGLLHQYIAQ